MVNTIVRVYQDWQDFPTETSQWTAISMDPISVVTCERDTLYGPSHIPRPDNVGVAGAPAVFPRPICVYISSRRV